MMAVHTSNVEPLPYQITAVYDANERAGVSVDVELKVEVEPLAVDDDRNPHSVTDPLGIGEEDLERITGGLLVRSAARTPARDTLVVCEQDTCDERTAEGNAEMRVDVVDESLEGAEPSSPGRDDHLDVKGRLLRDRLIFRRLFVVTRGVGAEPTVERTLRNVDRPREGPQVQVCRARNTKQ